MTEGFKLADHILVPRHEKLSEEEKKKVLEKLNVNLAQMPKIFANDPAIRELEAKAGDLIRITRKSPTALESIFYRVVVNG